MELKKDQSLETVRKIILEEAQKRVNTLEGDVADLKNKIENKESLMASLAPVIADLLERKTIESKDEMVEALSPIMGAAIKRQVAEAKDDVVDALYPVMGKLIRKSIAESMKKLIENINQKIDKTLRSRLFARRVQSKITGVSEAELVLKDALPCKIEEIFLIHKSSGLLIAHVTSDKTETNVNTELISGMLTAIQDFIRESFASDSQNDLDEIKYGDLTILLEPGHYSYLAVVVSGMVPAHFYDHLHKLDRRIHNHFYKQLRKFDGDKSKLGDITAPIQLFVEEHAASARPQTAARTKPYFLYLLLFLLIAAGLTWAYLKGPTLYREYSLALNAENIIQSVPGLESQSIKCSWSDDRLIVRGNVFSFAQKAKIDSVLKTIDYAREIENKVGVRSTRRSTAEIERRIREKLADYPRFQNLNPRFILEEDHLIIEGTVPDWDTKRELGFLVSEIAAIRMISNNLKVSAMQVNQLTRIRQHLKRSAIFFGIDDLAIAPVQITKLDSVVQLLEDVEFNKLKIIGYSDNSADSAYNLQLSEERARNVANYFISQGIRQDKLQIEFWGKNFPIATNDTPEGRARNRRVEFEIF